MTDAEIEATSAPELRDLPGTFGQGARVIAPATKGPISIRIDRDVVTFLREAGPRDQSRINAVLRRHVDERTTRNRGQCAVKSGCGRRDV
jgi:uncharacterized protein (DUF4415 family)